MGFVRQDYHVLSAAYTIFFIAIALSAFLRMPARAICALIGIGCGVYLYSVKATLPISEFSAKSAKFYSAAYRDFKDQLQGGSKLQQRYDSRLQTWRSSTPFQFDHSKPTDIYSYSQHLLLANSDNWRPRPAFQSYSAYTPDLLRRNLDHLLSERAPEQIVFAVQAFGRKLPALDDGVSWPVILRNYRLASVQKEFATLEKCEDDKNVFPHLIPVTSRMFEFGETIDLPQGDHPLFARIHVRTSLLGELFALLFKGQDIQLVVKLKNGKQQTFFVPATMLETGFIVSPLIRTTDEFVKLQTQDEIESESRVKEIKLNSNRYWDAFYIHEFRLELEQVNLKLKAKCQKLAVSARER
jgi:hypothetical protein